MSSQNARLLTLDDVAHAVPSPCGHAWSTSGATITPHPAIPCPQAHRSIVSNYFQSARQNGLFNHGLLVINEPYGTSKK